MVNVKRATEDIDEGLGYGDIIETNEGTYWMVVEDANYNVIIVDMSNGISSSSKWAFSELQLGCMVHGEKVVAIHKGRHVDLVI